MVERKNPVGRVLTYIALLVIVVVTLLPLAWMLSASLKTADQVFGTTIQWIPKNPQWGNYVKIWQKIPLATFTFNSLKLAVIITCIQLLTSSFAAYGFAKCTFKGRDALFLLYVATFAVPWQVYMLPQYIMMQKLGLVDKHISIILLQSFIAFGVFLLRQFYQSIPNELMEAARIDGLSEYGIYARIVLPLSKPSLATLAIFSFVTVWNDFMGPLIYFNSTSVKTIQLGVRLFISLYSAEYNLIMAAAVVTLVPVFVLYVAFQRFFVQGIATSGLKG